MGNKRFLFGLRGKALETGLLLAIIFPAYTLLGWNNGIAGSIIDLPSWVEQFPEIDTVTTVGAQKQYNSQIQGTVVGLYPLGAFVGALSCIFIGDPLGRLRTMGLGAIIHIIGVIIDVASFSLPQLIVGRLILGIGFGMLSATAPNWQSECASADHRGAAVILESCFISLGLALQGWVSFGFSYLENSSAAWRVPYSLLILWALLVLLGLPFVPESPRWLVKQGRIEEAALVLSALHDAELDASTVQNAISEIEASLTAAGQASFLDVFRNGNQRYFNRACLACAVGAYQQLNGINALAFYLSTIFRSYLGLSSDDSRILSASVFTWQTLCSPLGVLLVDKLGRRKLMISSAIGMGVCMVMVSALGSQTSNKGAEAAAAAFIFIFSFWFPVGFLGMSFLYASEISPLSVRTYITGMSTSSVWLWNFVVAEATPAALTSISYRYFIVFAAINLVLIAPSIYFFFPETSRRSLEQVDQIFIESKTVLDPVKVSRRLPRRTHQSADGTLENGNSSKI